MTFDSVDLTLGRPLKFAIVLSLACDDLQLVDNGYLDLREEKVYQRTIFFYELTKCVCD